jgi:hypothetical protein
MFNEMRITKAFTPTRMPVTSGISVGSMAGFSACRLQFVGPVAVASARVAATRPDLGVQNGQLLPLDAEDQYGSTLVPLSRSRCGLKNMNRLSIRIIGLH